MLLLFLLLAVFTLAYANGANDNFKSCATVYGTRALPYKKALAWATAAQLAGSATSLLLGTALLKAFSGKGLVPDALVNNPAFLVSVGAGAALAVLCATRVGLPISTTHALIGGLVGTGLALAPSGVVWQALGWKYFFPLVLSPFLATATTAAFYPIARALRQKCGVTAQSCVCVENAAGGLDVAPDGTLVAHSAPAGLTVRADTLCVERYQGSLMGVSAQQIADTLHLGSAFALGFARGLNDTPKILTLLISAKIAGIDMRVALLIVAAMMAVGGLLHSKKLAQTMGDKITPMNTGQGLLANLVSSALVISASLIGSPVSTTHVSTGAIFGIGAWTGKTNWRLVTGIALAWVGTLPLAGLLAYLIAIIALPGA